METHSFQFQSLFLNIGAGLQPNQKKTSTQVFPHEFCKIFQNIWKNHYCAITFFYNFKDIKSFTTNTWFVLKILPSCLKIFWDLKGNPISMEMWKLLFFPSFHNNEMRKVLLFIFYYFSRVNLIQLNQIKGVSIFF